MSKVSEGRECFHSDEFRAFAVKWLGFDPRDKEGQTKGNRSVEIRIACDECVTYTLQNIAYKDRIQAINTTSQYNERYETYQPIEEQHNEQT